MNFNLEVEEINYIKFSYSGEKEEVKDFRAIVKSYNDREMVAYAKNQDNLTARLPQGTTLHFVCNNGIYEAQTSIKAIEIEEPYVIFIFEKPKNISYKQNRDFFRIPAVFDCIYKIAEKDGIKEYKTKSIDISANGISLLMPSSEMPKTFSIITMFLNGKSISTDVKFVRSEKYNNNFKYAFTFTQISEKDQDFISQFCFQKQLEKRRSTLK